MQKREKRADTCEPETTHLLSPESDGSDVCVCVNARACACARGSDENT